MNLASHIPKPKEQAGTPNQRAELAMALAKRLEKNGEYSEARKALLEFWPDSEGSPHLSGLDSVVKAEMLQRVGAISGWLGSAAQIPDSQETSKNLITRSIELFEKFSLRNSAAEARGDLALCYWREGSYDEARITLQNALDSASDSDGDLRAMLLIRAGIIEDERLHRALQFYDSAASLLERSEDHGLKGALHNEYGLVFRRLASESHGGYLDRALIEYAAASFHFEQAGNTRYLARVENNLGFLYFTIGRYRDAHEHLNRARGLFLKLKDVGTAAQVDETRARTLLAEGRLREADRMIKASVKVLENGGQQALLAEALTTQGTIAARIGNYARATLVLQQAITIAETVGDREGSGRAHLTIVEELGSHIPLKQLVETYQQAVELLDRSQDPATRQRLISCARKVIHALLAQQREGGPLPEGPSWEGFSLKKEVAKLERLIIERALRDAGGSVTKASQLLGFRHHQSLIGLINTRHREVLSQRSVVRKRRHHLFSQPKRSKKKAAPATASGPTQVSIIHVEDDKLIAGLVEDLLVGAGYRVQTFADGLAAWEVLKTHSHCDVLVVDNNLPGVSGLELVLRVRSVVHRRNLPIIMLSADDVEREAWRAGVDAFLSKTEAASRLAATVERLLVKPTK